MTHLLDRALALLMRPRVRRVRRWSFLVTGPVALLVAWRFGVQNAAGLVALRLALFAVIAWWAWRLPGERGDAVRDLIMHPRVRALTRTEADVWLTLPRLLSGAGRRAAPGMAYHRGTDDLPIALAFLLPLLAEGAVIHLLLPADWWVAHLLNGALHLYGLLWLLAIGLGRRAWPHAVRSGTLVVRNGVFHRARVPLELIERAEVARERVGGEGSLHLREGAALLPARRRVDVRIELRAPVRVARPLDEPVSVTELALASDDPEAFVRALAPSPATATPSAPAVVAAGVWDALHPA